LQDSLRKNIIELWDIFKQNRFLFYYQIIDKIYYFLFFLLLARTLDTSSYGSIIITFTFANMITMLFSFGFPIFLQRETAHGAFNKEELFTRFFTLNFILCLPAIVISRIVFKFIYPDFSNVLFLVLFLIIIFSSGESISSSFFRGLKQYKTNFLITLIIRLISLIIMTIIWFVTKNSYHLIFVFIFCGLLLAFILFLFLRKYYVFNYFKTLNFKSLKTLIILILPIWLATLFNFSYDKIDIFLISKLLTLEQVSFYSIAYGILKSSTIAFNFLLIGSLSQFASISNDINNVKILLKKYSRIITVISLILFPIMFFGGKLFLPFIYTEKYQNSVYILQILSFSILPIALNNLTGAALNGLGFYRENMYVTIIGFLFNLSSNIIIIPFFGIIGAAYITILTEIIILAGNFYFLKNKLIN